MKEILNWRQGFLEAGVAVGCWQDLTMHLQQSAQLAPRRADSTGEVVHAEAVEKETAG